MVPRTDWHVKLQNGAGVTAHPRILIGTLYSGESEFQQCIESLRSQSYPQWEHRVYRNLPNKEAHDTLYREFMNMSDEFDLFLKLDADMVLIDSHGLETIVDLFRTRRGLDHLQMIVHDWFSDSTIMGAHVYSNRVVWTVNNENLFVDSSPPVPGNRWRLWGEPAPLIIHSPDPSPFQAFRFGVHRALKAVQPDRNSFHLKHAQTQWCVLKSVWRHFRRTGDRRLGLAVVGADQVIQGKVDQYQYDNTKRDELLQIYTPFSELTADELHSLLRIRWDLAAIRELRYKAKIGPGYLQAKLTEYERRVWGYVPTPVQRVLRGLKNG